MTTTDLLRRKAYKVYLSMPEYQVLIDTCNAHGLALSTALRSSALRAAMYTASQAQEGDQD